MTSPMGLEPAENISEPRPEEQKKVAGRSPTQIALQRLRHDKVAVVCGSLVVILALLGALAPLICDYVLGIGPNERVLEADGGRALDQFNYPTIGPPYYGFTWDHPLGIAPNSAYDNTARLLYGIRTSMLVAVIATVAVTVIGIIVGLVSGMLGGTTDRVLSFLIDLFLSFPFILGALSLAPIVTDRFSDNQDALQTAQFVALVGVLVVFGWMSLARLIRGQVLTLRDREFVQAARVIGVPTRQILFKELLPNMVAPIVVSTSLMLPAFVAAEAGLAFLGLGLTGVPSLGQTIASADGLYSLYPIFLWAPVVTVMVLVLALNLLGDSVRDAFDPKTRR